MKRLIRRLSKVADSSQYQQLGKWEGGRHRVPEGHVPVFVGEEMERFAIRADLLGRPAFLELLRRSAMEYGYGQTGVLRIPCSVHLFRRLLIAAEADAAGDLATVELARSLPDADPISC